MKILSYFAFMNFVLLLFHIIYGVENIKKSKTVIPYIMLSTSLALWSLGTTFFYVAPNTNRMLFWYRFSSLGWITFPAIALHFFLALSRFLDEEEHGISIHNSKILYITYLAPCIFLIRELICKKHIMYTSITPHSLGWIVANQLDNTWSWLYILYLSAYFIFGFYTIKKWGKESVYHSEKKHSLMIFWVSSTALILGCIADVISPLLGGYFPPIANLFLIMIIIGIFFEIRKYKPFDGLDKIKARTVLNSIDDPVMFFDTEYKLSRINEAVTTVLGYSFKEVYLQELIYILPDHKYNEKNVGLLFKNKHIRNKEIDVLTADGRILNTIYSATIVENEYNEFIGYIITFKDVTDKKTIENQIIENNKKYKKLLEELSYSVKCDPLTGLLNRDSFYHEMNKMIRNYNKFQSDFAIIFADLNGFKAINDRYGHNTGDYVISEVANRLKKCADGNGMAFRMGGDEFIIVLSKRSSMTAIIETMTAIRKSFSREIITNNLGLKVNISLGYAIFSESHENMDEMIHKADVLMYADKAKYKTMDKGE
ncbi:MAG TPA: diguanylate cyclase [Epulopiscium sp.]|nr:diguanylate cyclase [Candidatus Epulonipiscium sp.]